MKACIFIVGRATLSGIVFAVTRGDEYNIRVRSNHETRDTILEKISVLNAASRDMFVLDGLLTGCCLKKEELRHIR